MERKKAKTIRFDTFDWDELESVPKSEQDIAEATVEFINGSELVVEGYDPSEALLDTAVVEGSLQTLGKQVRAFREMGLLPSAKPEERPESGDTSARYRVVYRDIFSAFIRDRDAVSGHFAAQGIMSRLPVETFWMATANGMAIVHRYTFDNFENVITVGAALLFDLGKGFGKKLCQCRLDSCGKFFFEIQPPRGAPQRKYCCSDHMTKAHDLNAGKRMAKHRSKPARKK